MLIVTQNLIRHEKYAQKCTLNVYGVSPKQRMILWHLEIIKDKYLKLH